MAHGFGSSLALGCQDACNRVEVPLMLVRNTGLAEFRNNPLSMNQDSIGYACACARACAPFLTTTSGRKGHTV